jgi:hypothetical protein
MALLQNVSSLYSATASSHSFALTLGSGVARKVVIAIGLESIVVTISNVAYNGAAATQIDEQFLSPARMSLWYVDVPNGTEAGTYDVTYTTSDSISTTAAAWQLVGAATGAAEDSDYDTETDGGGATVSIPALTVTAGSIVLSAVITSAVTGTWSGVTGVTERWEGGSGHDLAAGEAEQAGAGSVPVTWTYSSTAGAKVALACSIAAAASGLTAGARATLDDEGSL